MQKVTFRFDDFDSLNNALDNEESDLELPEARGVRDGQWLLAMFTVGEECACVAGRVIDRGTELRLTFEERDLYRLRRFASGEAPASLRPSELPGRSLPPGSRVLVVSENEAVASMLACMLIGWGAQVRSRHSAEEALDSLRSEAVDAVLVDSSLPGLTAADLCSALRRSSGEKKPPVLLLCHDPSGTDAAPALGEGADDFVAKPFRAPELCARLAGLLTMTEAKPAAHEPTGS